MNSLNPFIADCLTDDIEPDLSSINIIYTKFCFIYHSNIANTFLLFIILYSQLVSISMYFLLYPCSYIIVESTGYIFSSYELIMTASIISSLFAPVGIIIFPTFYCFYFISETNNISFIILIIFILPIFISLFPRLHNQIVCHCLV